MSLRADQASALILYLIESFGYINERAPRADEIECDGDTNKLWQVGQRDVRWLGTACVGVCTDGLGWVKVENVLHFVLAHAMGEWIVAVGRGERCDDAANVC